MAAPIALFFFTLFFYLRTLCATFNINDSGETIVDSDLLSIAHSPGYPLHTLLGRIFCLLPLGQPMFRLTFGSSLMGAAAVTLLYLIMRKVLKGSPGNEPAGKDFGTGLALEIPALFSALVFAFSYQHWFQAGGAKGSIYTFNTLLAASTVLILLKMREPGWFKRGFALFAFFLGLALSVHWETQAVLLPAYAWLLFSAQNRVGIGEIGGNLLRPFDLAAGLRKLAGAFSGKAGWARTVALLLLPLSTYLYLPLRSALGPAINWWDPKTFSHFLTVVTRGNYSGVAGGWSWETVHRNFARFWLHAHDQWGAGATYLLFALALGGLAWMWRNRRVEAAAFLLFAGGVFGGVVFYTPSRAGYEWTLDNFFTPVFLALALFAGAGLSALLRVFSRFRFHRLAALGFGAACLGLALTPMALNYRADDQSAYTVSYDEGLNMLKTTQRNGVILCNGDIDILPLWYLQLAGGKRPDVASFTTQFAGMEWYRDDITRRWPSMETYLQGNVPAWTAVGQMVRQHGQERPFYTTNIDFPTGDTAWLGRPSPWLPDGLLWKLPGTQGQNFAFDTARVNELWSQYELRNLQPGERKYWDDYTDVMKDSYGQACSFTGDFAMASHLPAVAQWSYEKALQYRQPQTQGFTYLKLAEAQMALGRPVDAIGNYQQSIEREPHSPDRPYFYAPYAYARLGDAFFMEKDYASAGDAYRVSLKFDPQQKQALDGLQRLNQMLGRS